MEASEENTATWQDLAAHYERARSREDSLDTLVEWPAQRAMLGDVAGRSFLDLGCGNGAKLAQLVREGAGKSVGIDISGQFIADIPAGLELVRGDLAAIESMPAVIERRFDRILFLQSFGYAIDPVATLRSARRLLTDDGYILLTRTQPLRYAQERAEQNGTTLGEEYFANGFYSYRTGWNQDLALTKRTYMMSDLLNTFAAAGLWAERTVEPHLSRDDAERFPHKQAWMNRYLGILIFRLRPVPGWSPSDVVGEPTR